MWNLMGHQIKYIPSLNIIASTQCVKQHHDSVTWLVKMWTLDAPFIKVQSCLSGTVQSLRNGPCYKTPCYKWTILQRNYRKMIISWSFSCNSFVKFQGKKFGSHNMTLLYPNPCYNEVCYIETALGLLCSQWRLRLVGIVHSQGLS